MIDREVFGRAWKTLCRRFGRTVDDDELREYYAYLADQLGTEEFQAAARGLWASREFFPRPDDFLDAVRASPEAEAAAQWDLCRRVMSGDRRALAIMTPAGQKTVQLMGGVDRLRNTLVDEEHFRRQEFMRLYDSAGEVARREQSGLPWGPMDEKRIREALPGSRLLSGAP